MEKASQDQARQYNLRRRQWTPAVGDVVWAKDHQLSKAAQGFAAKLAPRYDGPNQVVDIVSPLICKIRHTHLPIDFFTRSGNGSRVSARRFRTT